MAESARPSVFVGSSTEGLDIARAVQVQLDHDCQVEVWTDGLFTPGKTVFGALIHAISRFDFAVLVVTPDDVTLTRKQERNTTRDNVVFELGLFLGALGQDRVFMLRDRTKPIDLPSDLVGVISADYQPHDTGNAEAAVGAACTRIRQQIRQLGVRPSSAYQQVSDAAAGVDRVGEYVRETVRLLARSRRVELDIVSRQFGGMIEPGLMNEVRRDLDDLANIERRERSEQNDG